MTLPLDVFVRSIGINHSTAHAFFLGAGSSSRAGVPDADTCIWEWKRDIYLTNHPGVNGQLRRSDLSATRQAVQEWLDAQGLYPPLGSAEEYGFYVEHCYPLAEDRRAYFYSLSEHAQPTVGHHLLCLLAEAEIVKSVWTTNFDSLVLRAAAAARVTPIEVSLGKAQLVNRLPRRGELMRVALHGDYRYDWLKNTPEEVRKYDQVLRDGLVEHLKTHTLIVSGYSGRDQCIMDAFRKAYSQPGATRLYWCGYPEPTPPAQVEELLTLARANGHTAYYVPTGGFEDLLGRLALHCLSGDLLERARNLWEMTQNYER